MVTNKWAKRYQQSERGRLVTRLSARKYWQTERGKEVRKRYLERNAEKLRAYQRAYHKRVRDEAREAKICMRCRKAPVAHSDSGKLLVICESCRDFGYKRG